MSTLYGDGDSPHTERPITSPDQILETFHRGTKTPDQQGIGIEYERLPVFRETGLAVPYADPEDDRSSGSQGGPCVERFLAVLESGRGWRSQRENGHIISLERGQTRITLEPGGQVELSGRVHRSIDTARCELEAFVREVDETAAEMGIAFLGLGFHPFSDFHRIDAVPKHRYKIMAPYLGHRGHLAHGMMKATAGCQINLDYSSEDDAMEKMRVAMGVSSLVTAMCANSPLARGKESGFLSLRSHIWMHTDPDRCGLLPFVFRDQARFSDYADYALGVPMLFVVREGRWIDMTACTFRSFLEGGFRGLSATLDDWELHLTTLFPEVRLKSWLELRGSDSGPPDMILAQATLWKALLYDQRARRAAWRLVAGASPEQRLAFHRAVPRSGLHAKLAGRPAMELALELLEIAQEPLPPDEIALLDPLVRTVRERRRTPAEDILSHWSGAWAHDPRRLVASLAPDPRPRGT